MKKETFERMHCDIAVVDYQQLFIVEKDKDLGTDTKRCVVFKKEEKKRILTMCHRVCILEDETFSKVTSLNT